jgi:hypothetical protein
VHNPIVAQGIKVSCSCSGVVTLSCSALGRAQVTVGLGEKAQRALAVPISLLGAPQSSEGTVHGSREREDAKTV